MIGGEDAGKMLFRSSAAQDYMRFSPGSLRSPGAGGCDARFTGLGGHGTMVNGNGGWWTGAENAEEGGVSRILKFCGEPVHSESLCGAHRQ